MANRKSITLTKKETKQTINLKKLLGRKPSAAEKEMFVTEAIEVLISRAENGEDINGKSFKPYSKEYAEEKGVSVNDVDMTLSGDMLLAIRRKQKGGDNVEYGIFGGVDALKSYNHNFGDTLPKRQFFGLTPKEAKEIAASIKSEDLTGLTAREIRQEREASFLDIINNLRLTLDDGED